MAPNFAGGGDMWMPLCDGSCGIFEGVRPFGSILRTILTKTTGTSPLARERRRPICTNSHCGSNETLLIDSLRARCRAPGLSRPSNEWRESGAIGARRYQNRFHPNCSATKLETPPNFCMGVSMNPCSILALCCRHAAAVAGRDHGPY